MPQSIDGNRILAFLSRDDRALIGSELEDVDLPLRYRLAEAGAPIEHVYFLDKGVASMTTKVRRDVPVEVGLIGREGVVNVSIVLGGGVSICRTFMQIAGFGQRIAAPKLLAFVAQSPTLQATLLSFVHVLMVQEGQTALANARATISERLARWLLMARDREDTDQLLLTHDFLSTMLGVRRPGVTSAMSELERRGLVSGGRGMIEILDREGLEIHADGYYGVPEAEWRQMFADT